MFEDFIFPKHTCVKRIVRFELVIDVWSKGFFKVAHSFYVFLLKLILIRLVDVVRKYEDFLFP